MFVLMAFLLASAQPTDGKIAKMAIKGIENGIPAENISGYDQNTRVSFMYDYRTHDDTLGDTEQRLKGCKSAGLARHGDSSVYVAKWNCPVEAWKNTFTSIITVEAGKIVRIDSQDAPLIVAPAR